MGKVRPQKRKNCAGTHSRWKAEMEQTQIWPSLAFIPPPLPQHACCLPEELGGGHQLWLLTGLALTSVTPCLMGSPGGWVSTSLPSSFSEPVYSSVSPSVWCLLSYWNSVALNNKFTLQRHLKLPVYSWVSIYKFFFRNFRCYYRAWGC